MEDITLTCKECKNTFTWSEKEQLFFKEKHFNPPKRCLTCRRNKNKMYEIKAEMRQLSISDSKMAKKVMK